VKREDLELYLKSRYAKDPAMRAMMEILLQIMKEKGVDRLENPRAIEEQISA
jgi:hypothetical protein